LLPNVRRFWLDSREINIRCIQFGPDRSDAKTLIDVEVEPLVTALPQE